MNTLQPPTVAGNGPLSTLAISRLTINITSSNRALKYTFSRQISRFQPSWVKIHVKNRRNTYLKFGYTASESCIAIFFSSTHVPQFYSRCSKKGGRSTLRPRIPRSPCKVKDAEERCLVTAVSDKCHNCYGSSRVCYQNG